MITFGATTVTVVNRAAGATRDRQNNPIIGTVGTFDLAGCFLQQQSADEMLDGRDSADTNWILFAPPLGAGQTVGRLDQVRVDATAANTDPDTGQTYATFDQVGHPDTLTHIDGVTHHLELILRRVQL